MARQGSQRGRGGPRRGQGRRGGEEIDRGGFEETVVKIYRCSKVVKGGRRFSFGALVVCGDKKGQVGVGYGKANEVPPAVEKGIKDARKALIQVPKRGRTIPHRVKATLKALGQLRTAERVAELRQVAVQV